MNELDRPADTNEPSTSNSSDAVGTVKISSSVVYIVDDVSLLWHRLALIVVACQMAENDCIIFFWIVFYAQIALSTFSACSCATQTL